MTTRHPMLQIFIGALLITIGDGCNEDTDPVGDEGGTGCPECDHGAMYGCYCQVDMEWVPLDDRCPTQGQTTDADCSALCVAAHGPGTPSDPRDASCNNQSSSATCNTWSPSTNIWYQVSTGIYFVDEDWVADLADNSDQLWVCDDAVVVPISGSAFEIQDADAGEALYELGLRNGDVPLSINGESLGSFTEAFEAFALYLNGETEYELQVLRGGSVVILEYVLY